VLDEMKMFSIMKECLLTSVLFMFLSIGVIKNFDGEIHNEIACIKILCLKLMLWRLVLRYRSRNYDEKTFTKMIKIYNEITRT